MESLRYCSCTQAGRFHDHHRTAGSTDIKNGAALLHNRPQHDRRRPETAARTHGQTCSTRWSRHVVNLSCKSWRCDSEYWRSRRPTHVVRFTGQTVLRGHPSWAGEYDTSKAGPKPNHTGRRTTYHHASTTPLEHRVARVIRNTAHAQPNYSRAVLRTELLENTNYRPHEHQSSRQEDTSPSPGAKTQWNALRGVAACGRAGAPLRRTETQPL